jgi:integrase/recombinase XerC
MRLAERGNIENNCPVRETAIVPAGPAGGILESIRTSSPAQRLLNAFVRGRNASTWEAYARDLADFATFLELPKGADPWKRMLAALERLISCDGPMAHELVTNYRGALLARHLSPATVNRRLSALRTVLKLGSAMGMVPWKLEVPNVEAAPYRDMAGPGEFAFSKMLAERMGRGARGVRDVAILQLLRNPGLRRGEVASLDLEHYRREPPALFVMRKRQVQRLWVTIPEGVRDALEHWIEVRGDDPGPLFTAMDPKNFGHRLTGAALYYMVSRLGNRAAGVKTRPHGLRHTGASTVARESNGNVIMVQRFLGHKDPRVSMRYIDAQTDVAGQAARLIDRPSLDSQAWSSFVRFVAARAPGRNALQASPQAVGVFVRALRDAGKDAAFAARAVCSRMPWWNGMVPDVVMEP